MSDLRFRDLRADEIEIRVGNIGRTGNGCSLLLYKDARCDMAILDETVGELNWQRRHYECKGNLYCGIAINRHYNNPELPVEWVEKSDCGVESREDGNGNEKKGEASDSFKRAGTNWGIGRELYSSPFIWLDAQTAGLKEKAKGGYETYEKFKVSKISIVNKKITGLQLVNAKNKKVVFEWGDCLEEARPKAEEQKPLPKTVVKEISDYFANNEGLDETLTYYGVTKIEELDFKQASAIINRIKVKKQLKGDTNA